MLGIKSNRTTLFYLGATASVLASSGIVYWYSSEWLTKKFNGLLTALINSNNNDDDKDKELTDEEKYINKYYDKFNSIVSDDIDEDRVKELKKVYFTKIRHEVELYCIMILKKNHLSIIVIQKICHIHF